MRSAQRPSSKQLQSPHNLRHSLRFHHPPRTVRPPPPSPPPLTLPYLILCPFLPLHAGDRFSEWGLDNGLHSTVTTLLTSAVLGYPFCLPDMIGGNAYFGRSPNTELLVRWAQANALMPAVQFSIAPWDMSEEADLLIAESLRLRETVLDDIVRLSGEACATLDPICRPMWWLDPTDRETFTMDDQFTVGDSVIVAPVLRKGEVSRDVYLTRGRWRNMLRPLDVYEGPRWIRNFPAPLEVLPCFQRVEESLLRLGPAATATAAVAR